MSRRAGSREESRARKCPAVASAKCPAEKDASAPAGACRRLVPLRVVARDRALLFIFVQDGTKNLASFISAPNDFPQMPWRGILLKEPGMVPCASNV